MTPKEAYKALSDKVNIEFYVGPHIARIIKDSLCADVRVGATAVNPVLKTAVAKQKPVVQKASK